MKDFPELYSLALSLGDKKLYDFLASDHRKNLNQKNDSFEAHGVNFFHSLEEWDSELFGLRVGKVHKILIADGVDTSLALTKFLSLHLYDYVVFRVPQYQIHFIQNLERQGCILLDTVLSFSLNLDKNQKQDTPIKARKVNKLTRGEITTLAESFDHGRFFTEPSITIGKKAYKEWLTNSLSRKVADEVFVLSSNGKVDGLLTLKKKILGGVKLLDIPLVVKRKGSSRPNVAQELFKAVAFYANQEKHNSILVTTQGSNIPAQRAYLKVGFRPYASCATLRWKG